MPDAAITFKWGRDDCATSPSTTETHEFPEPTMSRSEMMEYFSTHFGFTEDEVGLFYHRYVDIHAITS